VTRAEFADAVLAYCIRFRASETSGYRTLARNTAEGGVAHSGHLFALARDVVPDVEPDPEEASDVAERLGLRVIIEADHHHLQPQDWRAG
jgi:hypothetical protein